MTGTHRFPRIDGTKRPTTLDSAYAHLERLARHRDDSIATIALDVLSELRRPDVPMSAQRFGAMYLAVLRAQQLAAGSGYAREWRSLRGLCGGVYRALLRQFRRDVQAARTTGTKATHSPIHGSSSASGATPHVPPLATIALAVPMSACDVEPVLG
jgi:hypothetical protein